MSPHGRLVLGGTKGKDRPETAEGDMNEIGLRPDSDTGGVHRRWHTLVRNAAAAVLIGALSFVIGSEIGADRGVAVTMTGSGSTGETDGGLRTDGQWYEFEISVPWTAPDGRFYLTGWPTCLPRKSTVTGVRFAGVRVDAAGSSQAIGRVVWVDCRRE